MKNIIKSLNTLLLSIICLVFFSHIAMSQSKGFFLSEFKETNSLNSIQASKIQKYHSSDIYDHTAIVKIENIIKVNENGSLRVKLPENNVTYSFRPISIKMYPDGNYEYIGITGNKNARIKAIKNQYGVSGRITIENANYEYSDIGDGLASFVKFSDNLQRTCQSVSTETNFQSERTSSNTRSGCSDNVVRVLVMFTNEANLDTNPYSVASIGVSDANTVLQNSGISSSELTFELAGVQYISNFTETGVEEHDLNEFRANELYNEYRDDYDADVAICLVGDDLYPPTFGGWSTLLDITAAGTPDYAHAIVVANSANQYYTFAHELSHLFRCRHQEDSGFTNAVPTARGNNFYANGANRLTVMYTLNTYTGTRVPVYSGENVSYMGSITGTSDRDNQEQMITFAPVAANYNLVNHSIDPLLSGTLTGDNNTIGHWYGDANPCISVTNWKWETSTNGLLYNTVLSGTYADDYSQQFPYNNDLYIRLTVTASDGRSDVTFLHVYNEDNQNCGGPGNPCAIAFQDDGKRPLDDTEIKVFPNPIDNEINIELIDDHSATRTSYSLIEIIDMSGKVILSKKNINNDKLNKVTVPDHLKGVFILRMFQKDKITTKKIYIK